MGAPPALASASSHIRLADGRQLVVRPITPRDGESLIRFHSALSAESTRMRYLSPHPRLSVREVGYFTSVDHHRREALVALTGGDIVGVARFDRLGESDEAEVAFVVADEWHHFGVGSALLGLLMIRARGEGVVRFVADTLADNHPMLDVFGATGRPLTRSMSQGVVHLTFSIG